MLREEHRAIIRQLDRVHRLLDDKKHLLGRESIDALGAQLKVHLAHEEEALYRPLKSILKERSPTGELMKDHRSIRRALRELEGLAAASGGQASASDLRGQLQILQSALREHMVKEEKVAYWLADHHL